MTFAPTEIPAAAQLGDSAAIGTKATNQGREVCEAFADFLDSTQFIPVSNLYLLLNEPRF